VAAGRILSRYIEYFSPIFLFVFGGDRVRHTTGTTGILYIFMLPLIIAGIYCSIKYFYRNFYYRFALFGILIYPFAAMLTQDHFHTTRSLNGMPFFAIITLIGTNYIYYKIPPTLLSYNIKKKIKYSLKQKSLLLLLLSILIMAFIELSLYFIDYFKEDGYSARSRLPYSAPMVESFEIAFNHLTNNETLYISSSIQPNSNFKPSAYSQILFFGNISPAVYQKEGIPKERIIQYNGHISKPGILIRSNYIVGIDRKKGFFMQENREPIPEKHKLIASVTFSKKVGIIYEIYKVEPK
jgi:hypothetical protein